MDRIPFFNVATLREEGMEVLVFSSLESPYLLRRALQAGVTGVVDKTSSTPVIIEAIKSAARRELFPTAEWAGVIDSDADFADVHLSERQREVLELYAMGESARRVAEITGLSPETVQDYISRIRTKYAMAGRDASNKISLFRRAQEDGYAPGPWEA
ncbi:LuxR C-terminal-related transcriptional regulator [Corynebacterium vitaeruminis]|uniref:LuxR C-terminal-related transcriptional regulator n=1 Tax=Corynebacterium vitaeruminis TaxID=38305 RepID=UPI0028B0FA82|nr:LuxR C-terminal-related transcriptional regulator [Corynebacterium vitaeruminis]